MTNEPNEPNDPGGPSEPADPTDIPAIGPPPEREREAVTAPARPRRRLTRSRRHNIIAGVAGGLAEYLDADPTLVRIAIVVLTLLTGGALVLVYLGAWLVMPMSEVAEPGPVEPAEAARRRRGGFAGIFWGIVLILIGVVALLWRLDVALPPWDALLAGVLIAVGLLLLIEARRGLHRGLLSVAILLALILGLTAMVNVRLESGFGERFVAVESVQELEREYGHSFGTLTLDLRGIDFPPGITVVRTSMMFGELTVHLPEGVGLRATSTTLFGSTQLPGRHHPGFAVDAEFRSPDYATATSRVHIEITTLFGSTRVLQ